MTISAKERKAYGFPNPLQKLNPEPVIAQRAPKTSDTGYRIGQVWIDKPNNDSYILTSVSTNSANWQITTISITENAPISKYIVDKDGSAGYTTIQSALDAANAAGGGMVYVRPGTYTEDLILYDKTQIIGAVGLGNTGDFIIDGKHVPPNSGSFIFRNVFLRDAAHILYSTDNGYAVIGLIDVKVDVTDGYTFDLINWGGNFFAFNLISLSTHDGFIQNNGTASVVMRNTRMGAGTTKTMILTGLTEFYNCIVGCACDFLTGSSGFIDGGCIFENTLTFRDTAAFNVYNSTFITGSNRAISHIGTSILTVSDVTIDSTNIFPIGGTGTIELGPITYINSNNISATLTVNTTPRLTIPGLKVIEGTNATMGIATLVAGAATVNTTKVVSNSRIFLTHQTNAGVPGFVSVTGRVPGTSFTITSSNAGDTSDIAWQLIEPA